MQASQNNVIIFNRYFELSFFSKCKCLSVPQIHLLNFYGQDAGPGALHSGYLAGSWVLWITPARGNAFPLPSLRGPSGQRGGGIPLCNHFYTNNKEPKSYGPAAVCSGQTPYRCIMVEVAI